MDNPIVSIVCPIYCVEKYIEDCLVSLFEQTYKNIEYVFVNDKTPDNSMLILDSIIKKYGDKNVKVINHEKNLGLCGARRSGLKAATGDYLMIVDTDDLLPLNSVETLINCALSNNADYVESNFSYYAGRIGKTCSRFFNGDKYEYISSFIAMQTPPAIWGKLYRRGLFGDIDDLFLLGRDNVEDAFSTPILVDRAHIIANTNKVTYYYRIDNPNAYSKLRIVGWDKVDDMIYCVKRHEDYFKDINEMCLQNAIKEKKYWIKNAYYPRLDSMDNRKKLICLFPEIENYVKEKPFYERFCWFLMKHNMLKSFCFFRTFFNLIKILYAKLQ